MRLWKKLLLNGAFGVVALVAIGNFWIITCTHEGIYSDLHQIDSKKYGLVLGTNPTQLNGSANKFFDE
ncbi:MAG: SanA protein, partial [Bacteroidota bacterium]